MFCFYFNLHTTIRGGSRIAFRRIRLSFCQNKRNQCDYSKGLYEIQSATMPKNVDNFSKKQKIASFSQ